MVQLVMSSLTAVATTGRFCWEHPHGKNHISTRELYISLQGGLINRNFFREFKSRLLCKPMHACIHTTDMHSLHTVYILILFIFLSLIGSEVDLFMQEGPKGPVSILCVLSVR